MRPTGTKLTIAFLSFFLLINLQSIAQQMDTAYNNKIREYTTDKKFLPASVLNLVTDPAIPSPQQFFGSIIGALGVMHHVSEINAYFKKLDDASPFLSFKQVGTTEEGRPINIAIIGNEDAINRQDFYKQQLSILADPRKLGNTDVHQIINSAKPVFYLNGGLHSPEMGSPEMLMELAYRLITGNTDDIKKIRNNTIVIINPVSEPDGRDKQVDWYYRYSKSRTTMDDNFPFSPPYWGKYVFHDNNRDGLQVSQELTKAIYQIYYDWHPNVMLDLHESVPLIYMSTGTGPYNENIDPITISEWQVMANNDIRALAAQGLPGAFTWAFYDGWYPGYALWIANNHNSIGRFYETFGNAGGNTYLRDLSQEYYAGDAVTSKQWYRPDPATPKVYWSSRDNINYMEAGVLASLTYTADNAKMILQNFYQKGINSIRKGKEDTPKAFIIPVQQRDPAMAAYLVNQLRKQNIEVHKVIAGKNKNDYVILLDQPYRNLVVSLLIDQHFPQDAKFPPYDDIAWTYGYLYGVDLQQKDSLTINKSDMQLITDDVHYTGEIKGAGKNYVLNYTAQNNAITALYWLAANKKDISAIVLEEATTIKGLKDTLAAGSIVFSGLSDDDAKMIAEKFGLDLETVNQPPGGKQHPVRLPRVAIYHTWFDTQDAGWSRFTFDQFGIPYTYINKDDLKAGGLNNKFDVILMPQIGGSAADFINGIDSRFGPMPYTKTTAYPSHGFPDSSNDITGGPGFEGVAALNKFVHNGGVIISLGSTSQILADAGIANDLYPTNDGGLFHPGSVVNVKVRQSNNPVLYGYPNIFPIFRGNGPLLKVAKNKREMLLLQYGTKPLKDEDVYKGPILGMPENKDTASMKEDKQDDVPYVLSGMVRHEEAIIGQGAIFQLPAGKGAVIAFTFDPLHRFLNLHDAPMVWNAIINWDHLRKE